MILTRRKFIAGAGTLAIAAGTGFAIAQSGGQVIKVVGRKFEFVPSKIELKLNQPVTFELTTEDVLMGFGIPDFNVRADMTPGAVRTMRLTPDKTGTFDIVCDVFCGSGHEEMTGVIIVS